MFDIFSKEMGTNYVFLEQAASNKLPKKKPHNLKCVICRQH